MNTTSELVRYDAMCHAIAECHSVDEVADLHDKALALEVYAKQAMNVARLLTVSAPDKLVTELAAYKATDPRCGISGVHMYPLGGLKKTADWSYAVVDGNFELGRNRTGFEVSLPA